MARGQLSLFTHLYREADERQPDHGDPLLGVDDPSLPDQTCTIDLLEEMAQRIGTVRLIIVDPIAAYMGGSDGNNVETREVLEPLAEMANRLRIAVVAVTHLNKGVPAATKAPSTALRIDRIRRGGVAAYAVIEDPEDDGRRLLLQAKNNLGPRCKGLAFRMEQRLIAGDKHPPRVAQHTAIKVFSHSAEKMMREGSGRSGPVQVKRVIYDMTCDAKATPSSFFADKNLQHASAVMPEVDRACFL